MGASVLSMLLLLNGSITDWSNKKIEYTGSGKKAPIPIDTCGASLDRGGRIVGGWNATEGEFPWQVSLQHKNSREHFCGGSIIEPDIVVSAAHCVDGRGPEHIVVQAGILNLKNPTNYSQLRDVEKVLVHESYRSADFANDIALLKLEVPFNFTESYGDIGAVCLPAKDYPLEGKVVVTGWGRTKFGGHASLHLKAVKVPVIPSFEICNPASLNRYDSKIMFCAGSPGKDACQGDSGGTALKKEGNSSILVGVVSFGEDCGVDPGIYTRVTAYTDWIPENIVKLRSSARNFSPRKGNTYS